MATATDAAMFRESTPPAIGIFTTRSAPLMASRESPSPSVPKIIASRSGWSAARTSKLMAPSPRAKAATVKPWSRNTCTPPGQLSIRVHGTWNTVPIETLTARR